MKGIPRKTPARVIILVMMLFVYFAATCLINFSAVPSFYDGDMYCDYRYAMETWEYKSIFPDGWIFGNQLNAVSTPVLAAIFYGLTGHINFSMAAACVCMATLVVVCYDWMVRPELKEAESRLVAIVVFMTTALYCGKAVRGNQGWTLLFTMCSYYAGYSITAFLAFGCYLRSLFASCKKLLVLMVLTCILSFGTGVQSIRQTAIMIAPILAVEFLRFLFNFGEWKKNRNPLWTALGITVSNVLGLIYIRIRSVNQNQIFGSIDLTPVKEWKQSILECIAMIKDLLGADHPEAFFLLALVCILCAGSFLLLLKHTFVQKKSEILVVPMLLGISLAVIAVIDIFTSMFIRPRYYFMLYPLFGFMIGYLYSMYGSKTKGCLVVFVIGFFCLACHGELADVCKAAVTSDDKNYEISEFLLENDYTTIYAAWDQGNQVAVASNGQLTVGYWQKECIFEKVMYLCNPDVYEEDPDRCVYYFQGREGLELGMRTAEDYGVDLKLIWEDPEGDTYLCVSPIRLMH